MKRDLREDIHRYIAYLKDKGLPVTVHGRQISGLQQHNIHRNPFCTLVKTDDNAWQKCIQCQEKVYARHERECFFGMCHAGVEEYIFFVNADMFISVSGYGIDKKKAAERIRRLAQEYYLDERELLQLYEQNLKHSREDFEELYILVRPLCHMLNLLQLQEQSRTQAGGTLVDAILGYIQRHFMEDLSVAEIARACACSPSTVSHLFARQMGVPVKKYITDLRLRQAKKLLQTTQLSVGSVALMCGFQNINYFPTAFKKETGLTPTEYRRQRENPAE